MTAYDDELLTVTAVADSVLDAAKLSAAGLSPASRVTLQNSDTSDTAVMYRFGSSPIPGSDTGNRLEVSGIATIDGFDNLTNLKLRLAGGSSATVFVTYYR